MPGNILMSFFSFVFVSVTSVMLQQETDDSPFQPGGFKIGCFRKVESAIALTYSTDEPEACNTFCSLKSHPLSGQFWTFAVDNPGVRNRQCYCLRSAYTIRKDFFPDDRFCSKACPSEPVEMQREYTCLENTYTVYSPCKSGHWGPNFHCKSFCPYCNTSPPPLNDWTFCGFDGSCVDGCSTNNCNRLYECDRISLVPSTPQLSDLQQVWTKPDVTLIFPSLEIKTNGTVLKAVQITSTEAYPYIVIYRKTQTPGDDSQVWKKIHTIRTHDKEPRTHVYFDGAANVGVEPKKVQQGDIVGVAWDEEKYSKWPKHLHSTKAGYFYSSSQYSSVALQSIGWDQVEINQTQRFSYMSEALAFSIEVHIGCLCSENCANQICKRNGECYECEPGYRGLFCEQTCRPGRHGAGCVSVCSLNCTDQECDPITGECSNGCINGRVGLYCEEVCAYGKYGQNCVKDCGQCKAGETCSPEKGICHDGCADWFNPPFCKDTLMCPAGFYGVDCTMPCGFCRDRSCNVRDGSCVCQDYFYGKGCLSECGVCIAAQPCNSKTGICPSGCSPFFKGAMCNELKTCPDGYYGSECDLRCDKCLDNKCHIQNGSCVYGCLGRYLAPMCNELKSAGSPRELNVHACPTGRFGETCSELCINCKYNECDALEGTCTYGCDGMFFPPKCDTSCEKTHYGANCMLSCGQCQDGDCDPVSGLCRSGCQPGWGGPKCTSQCVEKVVSTGFWSRVTNMLSSLESTTT